MCECVLRLSVCPHWLIVRHNKALEIQPPGGLTWMRRPPTFSLKTATVQLRLRYTTMWQSHTRANICDLDATFKYGPIDGSFALLYFTSLNANWFPAVSATRVRLQYRRQPRCCCCVFSSLPLFKSLKISTLKCMWEFLLSWNIAYSKAFKFSKFIQKIFQVALFCSSFLLRYLFEIAFFFKFVNSSSWTMIGILPACESRTDLKER